MSNWWDDFSKPWRDVKKFGEDIYNHTRAYGRNQISFGFNGFGSGLRNLAAMTSYHADKYLDDRWDKAHGAERYWMSQIPVWGWTKQLEDKAKYYEDYYKHTGQDPKYSQVYGGSVLGIAGQAASQAGAVSPKRWARDLEAMFAPQFEENLTREQAFSKGYW